MSGVAILGGGGHASDVLSLIETTTHDWTSVAVVDEGTVDLRRFDGRDVTICSSMHEAQVALGTDAPDFIGGVGYPTARRNFTARADDRHWRAAPSVIHPSTQIMTGFKCGRGTIVMGLVWVSAWVTFGDHVYVGYGAKLGHDTVVGSYCSLFPGCFLAGNVTLGDACMIGANASVLPGVSIGDGAQIGAGAVVTTDVPAGVVVSGVPARITHE